MVDALSQDALVGCMRGLDSADQRLQFEVAGLALSLPTLRSRFGGSGPPRSSLTDAHTGLARSGGSLPLFRFARWFGMESLR